MANDDIKIPVMASRGKKRKDRAQGRSPAHTIYVRIEPGLGAALERYLNETEPRPSLTAVVELALRRYLSAVQYWPPKEE